MRDIINIVTIATHTAGYFDILKKSCINGGVNLTVLGYGEPWTGLDTKIRLLNKYLETKQPEDIIVLIDAFDVVMLGNSKELLERYKQFGKPIVLGVEAKNGWLKFAFAQLYFGTYCNNVINTGGYMGTVNHLRFLVNAACNNSCL